MGSDITYLWGSGVWGEARWSRYQATWANGVWGESLWGLVWFDSPRNMFAQMEKTNVGEYLGVPGLFTPGMDNFKSRARDAIRNLEKKNR